MIPGVCDIKRLEIVEDRAIAQIGLAMIDNQTLPAEFGDAMCGAGAVVVLLLHFAVNGDGFEGRRSPTL